MTVEAVEIHVDGYNYFGHANTQITRLNTKYTQTQNTKDREQEKQNYIPRFYFNITINVLQVFHALFIGSWVVTRRA